MAEQIVVGTDGSETAKVAVKEAVRLAKSLGAGVHLVSSYKPLRGAKIAGAPHSLEEEPADALLKVAGKVGASMIVVGSRGMHGAKRVLGSVPNAVSHKANCNVLIVWTELPVASSDG
jgi:nucleotide-binding universal stress UspA family protein